MAKKDSNASVRNEHDELTIELVHMTRRLKQRNLAIHELVKRDQATLDEAGKTLHINEGKFHEQHHELKAYSAKSWATMWKMLGIAVMIIASFLAVFLLILISGKN